MILWNVIVEQDGDASIRSEVPAESVMAVLDQLRSLFPEIDWAEVTLLMVSQAKP